MARLNAKEVLVVRGRMETTVNATEFVASFKAAQTSDAKRAVIEKVILRLVLAAHPGSCEGEVLHAVRCPAAATTVQWVEAAMTAVNRSGRNPSAPSAS